MFPRPLTVTMAAASLLPSPSRSPKITHWLRRVTVSRSVPPEVSGSEYFPPMSVTLPDAVAACRQGLLEPIDAATLPDGSNGAPAARDFVAGAIGPCWVGSVVYSQVIAYDPHRFGGREPSTLADFFDLKKFPGPRALRRASSKLNLEMALLADGVAPGEVYAALSTPAGVARALAKLDVIRSALVWWSGDVSSSGAT